MTPKSWRAYAVLIDGELKAPQGATELRIFALESSANKWMEEYLSIPGLANHVERDDYTGEALTMTPKRLEVISVQISPEA